jgi:hypothetical protein
MLEALPDWWVNLTGPQAAVIIAGIGPALAVLWYFFVKHDI